MDLALYMDIISHCQDDEWDAKSVACSSNLVEQYAGQDGLSDVHLNILADAICSNKLGTQLSSKLLQCLIPEDKVPDGVVEKIFDWVRSSDLCPSLERVSFRWFVALLQYDAGGKTVFNKNFDHFFVVLRTKKHLEVSTCQILYYLMEACDVRDYAIRWLLIKHKERSFSQLNSLLGRMKELVASKMPEWVKQSPLVSPHSSFDAPMSALIGRRNSLTLATPPLKWRTFIPKHGGSLKLPRLIPMAEYLERRTSMIGSQLPARHVQDYASVKELSRDMLRVSTPAQMMSLLANEGGFLMIVASPEAQLTRFLSNLAETLNSVFLMNQGEYTRAEKEFLLTAVAAMQVFIYESLAVVSKFLLQYLLIWDGAAFYREVHALLETLSFYSGEDIETLTVPLWMQWRCGSLDDRTSLLLSLKTMIINMIVRSRRAASDAPAIIGDSDAEYDVKLAIKAVGELIGEMLKEQLTWANPQQARILLNYAIEFYTEVVAVEQEADLNVCTVVPANVVYMILVSRSRDLIEEICGLLLKYHTAVRERLTLLCAIDEYAIFFNDELSAYFIDIYRTLFSNMTSHPHVREGLFTPEVVEEVEKLRAVGEDWPVAPTEALTIHNSIAWRLDSHNPISEESLKRDYSNTWAVKLLVEKML